uniref:Alpha-1,3-mannosyl-glycoprotein 2-beta-N-acetylglucosaminyltransferase n=1 Tax=Steinernema glaseri TaxID=37863 RepID=A0A1I8AHG8_9BILA
MSLSVSTFAPMLSMSSSPASKVALCSTHIRTEHSEAPRKLSIPSISLRESARIASLKAKLDLLEQQIRNEKEDIAVLGRQIREQYAAMKTDKLVFSKRKEQILKEIGAKAPRAPKLSKWSQPIPILVFVCNRAAAIKNHLDKLIKYRPSAELFPIYVSQDCDNEEVAKEVRGFGDQVTYMKHLSGEKAHIVIPPNHGAYVAYYRISRHYKLALQRIFDEFHHSSVVITEDDLDIAPDFFDYFLATRPLLEQDRSLFCVSAWNDNGKLEVIDANGAKLLYRSDFFPGLGWMMTSELWKELGPIWPPGFWDDWVRDPAQRKGRSCIRPEISRTGMTVQGKSGASKGLFFNNHLRRIHVNSEPVNFSAMDLSYLLKERYDSSFVARVDSIPKLKLEEIITKTLEKRSREESFAVSYSSAQEFIHIADALRIMNDFKVIGGPVETPDPENMKKTLPKFRINPSLFPSHRELSLSGRSAADGLQGNRLVLHPGNEDIHRAGQVLLAWLHPELGTKKMTGYFRVSGHIECCGCCVRRILQNKSLPFESCKRRRLWECQEKTRNLTGHNIEKNFSSDCRRKPSLPNLYGHYSGQRSKVWCLEK